MAAKTSTTPKKTAADSSTEARIKQAAHTVFLQKGFAATRVKDIADEAGINVALLSYYFRGKQKLFDLIMLENVGQLAGSLKDIISDADTSLEQKLHTIAVFYIDLLIANPDLPLFVLAEIQRNPKKLLHSLNIQTVLHESVFLKQLQQRIGNKNLNVNSLQIIINLLSLCIFPFVTRRLLSQLTAPTDKAYVKLMEDRKALIPQWIQLMLSPMQPV